ncbi:MAG: peptidylprolyl isomerase [Candidatus Micrarchaeaceae archaeon]|jgi:FKBP-type peptidyl-prolyl cis-trans isomerase 2
MAFKDGDFLEVEYTAWTASDNGMISTTDEKKAKEANLYDKKVTYGPVLVVLGSNSVIKGLDAALRTMSLNEQKKLTFKPEEAFGERIADLVRVMPLSEFKKRDMDPYPGMQVNMDNMTVIVKSVNSGRVVVDANHPYAGQEIIYEIKVTKQLTAEKEKVKALGKTYNVEPSEVEQKEKAIHVKYNNTVKKNADYFVGKANMIASVFTYFKEIEKVNIEEEYLRPKEGETPEKETEEEE